MQGLKSPYFVHCFGKWIFTNIGPIERIIAKISQSSFHIYFIGISMNFLFVVKLCIWNLVLSFIHYYLSLVKILLISFFLDLDSHQQKTNNKVSSAHNLKKMSIIYTKGWTSWKHIEYMSILSSMYDIFKHIGYEHTGNMIGF